MSKFTALADPGQSVLLRWPKTVEEPHDREDHKDAGNQYSESHRLALKSTARDRVDQVTSPGSRHAEHRP